MSALTTADRLAIHETLHRYCHCIDRGRWDEFATLFTDDCRLDLSPVLSVYDGAAGIRQFADFISGAGLFMRHMLTNVIVDGDGARAHAQSYVLALTGAPGRTQQATGMYDDQLVKQGDRWLLRSRKALFDMPAA
ncbi:MAG: nuclear transport factor 2 family protein [Candidatus Binatia bacterium]